jgi:NTP pyrophosphatase (non-canonical NTP hydrolase)
MEDKFLEWLGSEINNSQALSEYCSPGTPNHREIGSVIGTLKHACRVYEKLHDLTFAEYQQRAATTAMYPKEQGVEYTTLGLVGEAGEIANKVKKVLRGDYTIDDIRDDLGAEISDTLWYIAMLAHELDLNLQDIAQANLDKLADRKQRGVIKGSGDER